ncbi:MAG: RHS repeat-associated protein [Polaribacter sp.]|jgi:RHS repeat-associated protein
MKGTDFVNAQNPKNPYQFTGQEFIDAGDLGWYDYGARWYDPAVGRMMQVDPMASSYDSWSVYTYGMDNPVRYVDPTGMSAVGFNQDDFGGSDKREEPLKPEVTYTDLLPTVEVVASRIEKNNNEKDKTRDVFFKNLERSYHNGDFSGGNADEPEFFPIIFALPAALTAGEALFIALGGTLILAKTVDLTNELIEDIIVASGGERNIWPDGYAKPNPKDIDWNLGDSELADIMTKGQENVAKGGGTAWNLMKKWFNRKRKEQNNKQKKNK